MRARWSRRRYASFEPLEQRCLLAAIPVESFALSEDAVNPVELIADTLIGEVAVAEGKQLVGYDIVSGNALELVTRIEFDDPIVHVDLTNDNELLVTTSTEVWRIDGPNETDWNLWLDDQTGLTGAALVTDVSVDILHVADQDGISVYDVSRDRLTDFNERVLSETPIVDITRQPPQRPFQYVMYGRTAVGGETVIENSFQEAARLAPSAEIDFARGRNGAEQVFVVSSSVGEAILLECLGNYDVFDPGILPCSFSEQLLPPKFVDQSEGRSWISADDIDGNGLIDLVVSDVTTLDDSSLHATLSWYENLGNRLVWHPIAEDSTAFGRVTTADVGDDGQLDVVSFGDAGVVVHRFDPFVKTVEDFPFLEPVVLTPVRERFHVTDFDHG